MAYDKLVDSSVLDSDLEDVADAIRAKSGGSSQLAFPSGFISEIGNISTGGGSSGGLVKKTGTFTLASDYTYASRADNPYTGSILIDTGLTTIYSVIIWSESWLNDTDATDKSFGLSTLFNNSIRSNATVSNPYYYCTGISFMRNGNNKYYQSSTQGIITTVMDSDISTGSFGLRCHSNQFPIVAGTVVKWEAVGEE